MTSRERVRAVLNHELPDRVPNGLGGCETEGLHIVAYDKLQKILGEEATLVATGGLAGTIVSKCERKIVLDDNLLLDGLRIIYNKNKNCIR